METPDLSELGLPEKEQKILESAIKVFSEKGFSAATTSEIAKNAGVAEGTIFRYFKTKKDILRGILIQTIHLISTKIVVQPIEKILISNGDKDVRTILRELLYDRMKLADTVFPMARVVLTEALFHEDVREAIYENVIQKTFSIFADFHRHMLEKGVIRKDVTSDVMFRSILGNLGLFIAQKKMFGDKFEMENIDYEFDKMLDTVLYGIAVKKE